jgi:hypothetical protein
LTILSLALILVLEPKKKAEHCKIDLQWQLVLGNKSKFSTNSLLILEKPWLRLHFHLAMLA